MDLALQIIPVGDTTAREISAAANDVRELVSRVPGIAQIEPQRLPAPDHAKGGLVETLGGFLVSLAPGVIKALLQALQTALAGHPATKVLIQTKDGQVSFEFDPKRISLQELVDAAQRLRGAATAA
jgi:hypothetical protein